ncbi:DUF3383 family protein [Granulibacter bethesdensis]|uniref:DUF3383 family protein n=1 Tax=Granulibacter bethesdensis TaxID=364410 RepID=UPI0003F1FDFB|nr:DUF3383 family protein [Granulibacter bethesdensis]AHJ65959.1 Phage-related protein [Granulibacter bethesdensis CGDNIH4]
MANLDRLVTVDIKLQSASVNTQSFSDMLIVLKSTTALPRTGIITAASDLLAAPYGLTATHPAYLAAADAFSVTPHISQIYIGFWDGSGQNETLTAALSAMKTSDNSWYGLILPDRTPANILDAAAWAEANGKLFGTAIAETDALDSTKTNDTLSRLKAGNYFRTFCFYHAAAATDFPDAAVMSKMFTLYPGQESWANCTLPGVSADTLGEGQSSAVRGKNGNTFESFRNVTITQGGKTTGGEWIDVIRFRDWLQEEIKTSVFQMMVDNRIPYTDQGILMVKSKVQAALDLGVRRGGIAPPELDNNNNPIPSYTISVPLSANISANTKASRVLRDISFRARLAGAVHLVQINGTLSYTI